MKEKKVYVIQCESGHWDSHHTWIGGIYDDLDLANLDCKKLNDRAKAVQDSCPIKKKIEEMTDEEEEIYDIWWAKNQEAVEWEDAKVKDFELNELYENRLG